MKAILKNGIYKHLIFIFMVILVVFSQKILLEEHLKYGFSDVDWGFLAYYKEHKQLNPNIFNHLLESLKGWGVYTHQEFYIGIQSDFFGLNFESFQITTHLLKTLAIIALYPLMLSLTGSILAAFVGSILFAVAYPAVGTMYTVVTSSDYLAVVFMILFFWFYWFLLKYKKKDLYLQITALFLLLLTLFLSTERMYPIFFFIITIEVFLIFYHKLSKTYLQSVACRIGILLSPLVIAYIFAPSAYSNFIFGNGGKLIESISEGNWQNLLRPFISMGGLIAPSSYWRYLGIVKIQTFNTFLNYFLTGPMIVFTSTTLFLGYSIFKKSRKWIIYMSLATCLLGIVTFVLGSHYKSHFDEALIAPALIGGYMVLLGLFSFIYWLKNQQKDKLLVYTSVGFLFAFLYIVLTWMASDMGETPTGAHRYSTVPALLISLAVGSLLILIFKKLWYGNKLAKTISFLPFLILIPIILIWSAEVTDFFQGQLKQGFGAYDKQLMRGQLLSFLGNLDEKKQSLFYFDFNDDRDNAYYYDNTILGGFGSWMFWHPRINFKHELAPFAIWSRFDQLLAAKKEINGIVGFEINDQFYLMQNFYAFKLKNKKVYNIKDDIIKQLNEKPEKLAN